ncbi:MAG: conjugative transposon protein TraK [Bacteroidetes bacterium]|uniref:Conjugative transposon protein TraK n=1 Tax=Candidatus Enterocola intestinipullorum TaxID=2840783 RepID=A0A9D9EIV9_9BACT|nr:conjugative transposon protein TraK [Candidatus Enterocola intestinipullorum]
MFQSLNNIQKAFSLMKLYLVIITVACAGIAGFAVWKAFEFAEKQRQKIYVLDNGASLIMALSQDVYQNREAEAKSHVKMFHDAFFTISPDKSAIDYNIARALALAGREAADQYTIMKEDGFFDRIIAAGIHCEIRVDSVKIDVAQYPYAARLWGKTSLVRTSNVTYRNLETECRLVNCARSDDNPHGFMIEKWRILDNSDIAVLER